MNLALFDFDGTITQCDTFIPFIRKVTPPVRFFWGKLCLLPFIFGYKTGLIPASIIRQHVIRIGLKGYSVKDIVQEGQQYAFTFLPSIIRKNAMDCLNKHIISGDRIIIVSASLDVYLKPWCESIGVELICSKLEIKNNKVTGRYIEGDCTGKEKANRVAKQVNLSNYSTIYAYGDTKEDTELLNLADQKYYQWKKI